MRSGVSVQDVYIFAGDVDVAEKVVPHEAVIALRMVLRQPHIFVHVESHHILKRHFPFFVQLYKASVHAQRRASGGTSEHEWFLGRGVGFVYAGGHVVAGPFRKDVVVFFDNQAHIKVFFMDMTKVSVRFIDLTNLRRIPHISSLCAVFC